MTDTETPRSDTAVNTLAPKIATWTALAVCVVGTVMVILGAWRVGIWTDEPAHVMRYENLQQHGWYLLDDDFDGDEPGSWVTDQYVYAPVTTQLMHAVNRVLGLDPSGRLGTSVQAYAVRHLVVGLVGLLGVLAVAKLGRRLLGSWSWGVVAAAALMAIPMWPGLSMFDIKDVPAATGYTLVTLGLVELILGPGSRRRRSLWPVVVLAAGLVLALGTRPGLWPGLAASLALALVLPWARISSWGARVGAVALACGAAYGILLLAYPAFFAHLVEWVVGSVSGSAHYTGSAETPAEGSRAYLPARVVAVVMPPALLLLGVASLVATLPRRRPRLTPELSAWTVVGSQALLLPAVAVAAQSHLSDNLRQVLFACPAVALLLTLGWQRLVTNAGHDSRRVRGVLGVVWSAALLVPLAVQIQMFPYGYSYAAPQATSFGAVPEDDWGRLSLRELLDQVPRGEFLVCSQITSERGDTMRPGADCRTDPISAITPYDLAVADDDEPFVVDSFLALFTRGVEPGRNCTELGRVERWRYFSRAVLSRVARCELVLHPYPASGVSLKADGDGVQYLLDGWTSDPADPRVRLSELSGSLGFELPPGWDNLDLRVRFEGESRSIPELWVNNQPVPVSSEDGAWRATVPAATVAAMGEGRLVLTVSTATPGESLTLSAVSIAPA